MADDFDIEALLEEPYKKEKQKEEENSQKPMEAAIESVCKEEKQQVSSKEDDEDNDSSKKSKKSSKSSKKHKSRSRSRDRKRKKSSRSRSRKRSRSKDKRRSRSSGRKHSKTRSRSRNKSDRKRDKDKSPEQTPEERDRRTVLCMQLSARIRPRDLEEFFSSVGKVRDVRLITDPRTKRSKGIAYIEFRDIESVALAIGLTNQRLLGVPMIVQASQGERNRIPGPVTAIQHKMFLQNMMLQQTTGPMRLYVGSLHVNITEDMIKEIFEPFGKIDNINLIKDDFGHSKGYGFVQFAKVDEAKKAMEQLNGFELAGRAIKVSHVTESTKESSSLDSDETDKSGINLGTSGKLALMAKLAEGSGMKVPQFTLDALNMSNNKQNH